MQPQYPPLMDPPIYDFDGMEDYLNALESESLVNGTGEHPSVSLKVYISPLSFQLVGLLSFP